MKASFRQRKGRPGLFSRVNYFLSLSTLDFLVLAFMFVAFHIYRRGGHPTFWPLEAFMISFLFCWGAILWRADTATGRTNSPSNTPRSIFPPFW